MRILVTGGTGFVGSYLVPRLLEEGHEVVLLVRPGVHREHSKPPSAAIVEGDPMRAGPWWDAAADCDAAVNLVGESIQGRWTETKKDRIRQTRLVPLRHLVEALPRERPFSLVSASAVGFYGNAGDRSLEESAAPGADFLAELAQAWESKAENARNANTRVFTARFGLVLGANGGALREMATAMRRFMGGVLGSGRQWMSWIHEEDLVRAMLFLLEAAKADGPYNFCSPNPVRQIEMARTLGRLLHRPVGFPTPAPALRFALGGFADALLFSQRMVPKRLLDAGYEFMHPTLPEALKEIFKREAA